jgi:hypothetical protein
VGYGHKGKQEAFQRKVFGCEIDILTTRNSELAFWWNKENDSIFILNFYYSLFLKLFLWFSNGGKTKQKNVSLISLHWRGGY